MKRLLFSVAAAALLVPGVARAETWKGTISDSMCAAKHASEKQTDKAAARACVEKCVKGGSYVFVTGDKVFKIANQDLADLKTHAAHEVVLTGEMKGDTITVAKVEMPPPPKK